MNTTSCWCGCGQTTSRGAYFRAGHYRNQELAVILRDYGSIRAFLEDEGYEPKGATCWCGCGEKTSPDSDFHPGHDRRAVGNAIRERYANVVGFLKAKGYGPGKKSLPNA